MGLTNRSVGRGAANDLLSLRRRSASDRVIALAGNPNVGKSTVFNALTGMNQHTGNWPGKTVTNAQGYCKNGEQGYVLVDLPGTYSLFAHSAEEEVARDFLCFGSADSVTVVCDATCLERNLNLVLQILELTPHVVVCLNLMDEAKRKRIRIDTARLEALLGVPVVAVSARKKKTLHSLTSTWETSHEKEASPPDICYPEALEKALAPLEKALDALPLKGLRPRWMALRLLEGDRALLQKADTYLGMSLRREKAVYTALEEARLILQEHRLAPEALKDISASASVARAEVIAREVTIKERAEYAGLDRKLDRLLTGKRTAYPLMLLLLALVLWLTITAANYPSAWLSSLFLSLQEALRGLLVAVNLPPFLTSLLCDGVLGVLGWVISVMLPPMAIFFPLFTLLEDSGYLPRIAYNLDRPFHACNACGKQALTMCMGFGCNAAGVVGCRIIDSPRERLLAILTNSLVPCNGRFPALIAVLTMFFVGLSGGISSSLLAALLLTLLILLGILATFAMTKLLSATLLRGMPSSFTLELPPYRRPQVGRVLVRSILDRTLFVLGRSAAVAAPAGLLIWILANITVGDLSLLAHASSFLDPFAAIFGFDGVILMAFILGFPANEIVIPIMIMAYLAEGRLVEFDSLLQMKELFVANGWTALTALNVLIFFLFHWPCSTTLLTVKKETGSLRWTLLAALLPTLLGLLLCLITTSILGKGGF